MLGGADFVSRGEGGDESGVERGRGGIGELRDEGREKFKKIKKEK